MKCLLTVIIICAALSTSKSDGLYMLEACDIDTWIQALDDCFDDTLKIEIREMSEDEFSRWGGVGKYVRIDEHREHLDMSCNDMIYENLERNENCIRFCEDISPYLIDDYRFLIRRCYHRHLCGKEIGYEHLLDSMLNVYKGYDSVFTWRATTDTIEGYYIPKDLEDALNTIVTFVKSERINEFKRQEEDTAVSGAHFGFGIYLRNRWCLWGGSRLGCYFSDNYEIYNADYMSDIILRSWHRRLNNKPIDVDKQIDRINEYKKRK